MNPSFRCGNLAWFQDYLNPIIADADTGHGGITATMKLAKMFIENGAAGIHIEAGLQTQKWLQLLNVVPQQFLSWNLFFIGFLWVDTGTYPSAVFSHSVPPADIYDVHHISCIYECNYTIYICIHVHIYIYNMSYVQLFANFAGKMFEVCGLFLEVVRFSNRTRNQAPRSVVTWVARSWSPLRCCQQLGTSVFYGSVFWQLLIHIQSSITYHTYSYRGWACWYAQGDFVVSCISLEFSWICFFGIYKQALSSAPPFNNTCTRLVSPQALRHAHGEIGKVKSNLVWTDLCILYIHNIYM